jgi:hypothetical protein
LAGTLAGAISSGDQSGIVVISPAEGALLGLLTGVPVGALPGALTIPLKHPVTFLVRQQPNDWNRLRADAAAIQTASLINY